MAAALAGAALAAEPVVPVALAAEPVVLVALAPLVVEAVLPALAAPSRQW